MFTLSFIYSIYSILVFIFAEHAWEFSLLVEVSQYWKKGKYCNSVTVTVINQLKYNMNMMKLHLSQSVLYA